MLATTLNYYNCSNTVIVVSIAVIVEVVVAATLPRTASREICEYLYLILNKIWVNGLVYILKYLKIPSNLDHN